jgi:hypothetical protein
MRQNSTANIGKAKELARRKYAERQIDKWWKWSFEMRNCVKFKELVEIHERFNIKVHG